MAKHLQRGADGHLLRIASGHLANECQILCDDCEGHGPITATLTTTGACEVNPPDCADACDNEVISLTWLAGPGTWFGAGTLIWTVTVWCDANVWRIGVVGGCQDAGDATVWEKIFVPEGCETDNGNGYPTHSGIDMGVPTAGFCVGTCEVTVALS